MKVRVYPEGGDDEQAQLYTTAPDLAAVAYARDNGCESDLCVEALDDEAKALPGWSADEDATRFKVFKVSVTMTYDVTER